ncbi:conserved hypothetical protein [Sphingomonas sp. EC-HK361]|uniref:SH3 domain-containing protein n=1 Tax=Sphingomonas sp. EC-HK361 TaxID=2038397 RepID=UPI00125253B0|nr:SH3 domain-containing protein [Sphingomonas sp. EC-HK361]VVT11176.1 conserved hypothetical protein [Sphingomonas sp. EC-HK361]
MRLAEYVFAPHYAAPMPRKLLSAAVMTETRQADSGTVAQLAAGDAFDVLDVTGGVAWGIATGSGLVGYLPAKALGLPG